MPADTDTPSPVLENKDSSSLNTTLNDTDLLNDTLDGVLYSESTILSQKQQTPAYPAGQEQSCPSTPVKKKQPNESEPTAKNAGEMLDILTQNTCAKNYFFDATKQSSDIRRSFSPTSIIFDNVDKGRSRYDLEHIKNLFPQNATSLKARFVVIAKKNDETGKLESELWFSRINFNGDDISHAGTAFGREQSGYSLSAGELHFIKKNNDWVIEEINNQTGHFLCKFNALLLPLKLLINSLPLQLSNKDEAESLQWDKTVRIGQMANTNDGVNGAKSIRKNTLSVNVTDLKARLLNITVTLPDSVPEVVTTLCEFGSPKAQRTVSRSPVQDINNPQPLHPSIPSFSGFKSQETGSDPYAMRQPVQQINTPFTLFSPLKGEPSSRLPLPLPGFGVNTTAVNSSKLHDASQQLKPITKGAEDRLLNQRTDSLCSFNQNKTESVSGQPGRERDRDYDKTASTNIGASSIPTLFSPISSSIHMPFVPDQVNNTADNIIMDDSLSFNLSLSSDSNSDSDFNSSTVISRPA